jgi:hypothetical protein
MAIASTHRFHFKDARSIVVGLAADARLSIPIVMAIVMAIVIAITVPLDHDLGAVPVIPARVLVPMPMPISLAYLYPNPPDLDIGALRDDHRFVNNDRGTRKCRNG